MGGNHDHPKRLEAVAPILRLAGVHVRGDAVSPESGGVLQVQSRDGRESATIGVLPWVPESRVVDFEALLAAAGQPYQQYADAIAGLLRILGGTFSPGSVNILLGHLFVSGAFVGQEGGERPIHLGQAYAVTPEALPSTAQYVALGHVHRAQRVPAPAPTYYVGSPMQLDFGEAGQEKGVNIIEARPGLPAEVRLVPLNAGRRLRDVEGTLEELRVLAPDVGDDYLRVRVHLEGPVLELADRVREILPNAVDIRPIRPPAPEDAATDTRLSLGPEELVQEFYQRERVREMPQEVITLFRRLYEEERRETTSA